MKQYARPALKWLIKNDPEAALAVFHRLRDEYYTFGGDPAAEPHMNPAGYSADDVETHAVPDEARTSETMHYEVQDGPDEVSIEMLHEFRPDLHTMLRSAGGIAWPWCGVRWIRRGKSIWIGEPWAYTWTATPTLVGTRPVRLDAPGFFCFNPGAHEVRLAGLTFYTKPGARRGHPGGMLVSYVDADGKVQKPALKASKPRGGKRPLRAAPATYLDIIPTTPSPLAAEGWRVPFSGERMIGDFYDPLPRKEPDAADRIGRYGVAEARAELVAMGIDGKVKFRDLPFAGTILPTVTARGVRFIGGLSGRKQTTSMATVGKVEDVAPLDPVLEEVASRGTLKSIGIKLGYSKEYADRAAKRELLRIGRDLVAVNDNFYKRVAA
jgi:hypothetical protein